MWKHASRRVNRQDSNKNQKYEGVLKCEMWCWWVRSHACWRLWRARRNGCIHSLPSPFLQTQWLRVITISELCLVSLGHHLWASTASQTFRLLLLPSARASGTVKRARWVGAHTLSDEFRLISVPCVCILGFFDSTCGCCVNSNQWLFSSSSWVSGITCWKTDLGTNLMGWCVIPAKMLPGTPKNVSPILPLPLYFLSFYLSCSLFLFFLLIIIPPTPVFLFKPLSLYLFPIWCRSGFPYIKNYCTWKFSV